MFKRSTFKLESSLGEASLIRITSNDKCDAASTSHRVIVVFTNKVQCFNVCQGNLERVFEHDGHLASISCVVSFNSNPSVLYTSDEDGHVQIWCPNDKPSPKIAES